MSRLQLNLSSTIASGSRLVHLVILLWALFGVSSTNAQGIDNEKFVRWRDSDEKVLAQLLLDMPKGGELHTHLSGAIHFADLIAIAQRLDYQAAFASSGTAKGFVRPLDLNNPPARLTDLQEECLKKQLICLPLRNLNQTQKDALKAAVIIDRNDASRDEGNDFTSFHEVFDALDDLTDNADVIPELVKQAMKDAADHNMDYIELKITPYGRLDSQLQPVKIETLLDVIALAIENQNADFLAMNRDPVTVKLIAQIDRRDPLRPGGITDLKPIECQSDCHLRAEQNYLHSRLRQAYYLATASRYNTLVVGFDFTGLPEQKLSTNPPLGYLLGNLRAEFGRAHITIHAGESRRPERYGHVRQALELGADRIGHGVNMTEDVTAWETVCRMGVPIEINLTSNLLLGVVRRLEDHPFPQFFNRNSCPVTKRANDRPTNIPLVINTDDAGIFQTTMTNEFCLAATTFKLNWDEVKQLARNSLQHSFLPASERRELLQAWETKIVNFEQTWQPKSSTEGCRIPEVN